MNPAYIVLNCSSVDLAVELMCSFITQWNTLSLVSVEIISIELQKVVFKGR